MEQLNTAKSSISAAATIRLYRTWFDEVWLTCMMVVLGKSGSQTKAGVQIPLKLTLQMISM